MKNNNAITLAALIIAVIILLILATVSISVIINSKILDTANTSVKNYSDEETEEQIKLACSEYEMAKYTDNNLIFENFIENSLEKIYGLNSVTIEKLGLNYKIDIHGKNKIYTLRYDGTIKQNNKIEKMPKTNMYAKLDSDGTLYIRATPTDGYINYSSSASIGYSNRSSVLKAIIEEPIAPSYTGGMFDSCINLVSIENIENLHTENITNMGSMFYCCRSLESLDVSNWDTSKVTNMASLFNRCVKLKKIDVSNFDTSNVTSMSSMFEECTSVSELDISNFNTNKVTGMKYMFSSCYNLKSVQIEVLDTSLVDNMQNMFYCCRKLEEINISNFDTSKVTSMVNMFNRCSSVKNLDVSNFNTENVENMQNMFYECSVQNLDLSNFDTNKVTNMSGMFSYCGSLKTLNLSNKFRIQDNTNIDDMFNNFNIIKIKTNLEISNKLKSKFSNFTNNNFEIVE